MSGSLPNTIDDLYRVFARYQRPKWFVGCACCWGPGEPIEGPGIHGRIRVVSPGDNRPLRELEPSELAEVADQLPHLGGNVDVLRHYLPRVFDILVSTGFDWPDFEPVIARLNFGANLGSIPWSRWPTDEQRAIRSFFEALWTWRLQASTEQYLNSADTLVCGFGLVSEDITPFLTKWLAFDEPHSARHFSRFLRYNDDLLRGRTSNASWSSDSPVALANLRRIIRFLHAESTAVATLNAHLHSEIVDEKTALEECFAVLPGNNGFAATEFEKAVEANDLFRVGTILNEGTNPNAVDLVTGVPIWQIAFHQGSRELLATCVVHGADLNYTDEKGATLLHWLVGQDPAATDLNYLLRLGASPRVANREGWTPLHTAAQYGFLVSVNALIKAGADPLAIANGKLSCIDVASINHRFDMVELLESHRRP